MSAVAKGASVYCLSVPAADQTGTAVHAPGVGADYAARSAEVAGHVAARLKSVTDPVWVRQIPSRVFRLVSMPAVLVEFGFLTNPDDAKNLQAEEWQRGAIQAMVAAITACAGATQNES